MITSLTIDDSLNNKIELLSATLNKKKSEVLQEAIEFYSKTIMPSKEQRIISAIYKTKDTDFKEYQAVNI